MSAMSRVLSKTILALAASLISVSAPAQAALEGRWTNPHKSVIVSVARCGPRYCGTVTWASAHNREKGVGIGTRVLSDLQALGNGTYRGRALDPKHGISGSAIVRQDGPNVMVVKGCAVMGLVCKEQRWTRVS
jgi:uncharacterized protein (DUF2147 family)